MPVPGPLALIRQNRQQTLVVESSLNKYIASWPSPTPWPKTRLLQVVPNSQKGVVFIYQINSHSVCAILAYILYIFGFIILPIENMVSFGIRHIYCKTALHFSWFHWFSLVAIFELDIVNFSILCFCILPALLYR